MVTDTMEQQELMSLEDAAEFLCVSKSTVYRLLDQGKLQGMKAGKQWRFRKEDLLAYMQRGPAALALANLPMKVLDDELAFWAEELARAGATTEDCDDPALEGEAGKLSQLVRRMVWLVVARKGSDIHLEPRWDAGQQYTLYRLRVDGILHDIHRLPASLHAPIILEWKRLAGMDPDEHSRPQDGNVIFAIRQGQELARFRVSIVPTVYGEKVAIRTIPVIVPSMADLGIDGTPLREWISHSRGLMLIVGPTGSGKCTSAFACLRERVSPAVNIMSVEQPIEYLLPGVTQLHVKGFTRLEGLRAIYEQDMDIILLSELHLEQEIASEIVWLAETGHLVLSTMHARDTLSPLFEFVDCGVKRSLLAANLIGIAAQCLLRKLCLNCKRPAEIPADQLAEVRAAAAEGGYAVPEDSCFYTADGCETCHGTGYQGRFALHEYFTFTPALREAFLNGTTQDALYRLAIDTGNTRTLFAEGIRRVVEEGITSIEEVFRVVPIRN